MKMSQDTLMIDLMLAEFQALCCMYAMQRATIDEVTNYRKRITAEVEKLIKKVARERGQAS